MDKSFEIPVSYKGEDILLKASVKAFGGKRFHFIEIYLKSTKNLLTAALLDRTISAHLNHIAT